MMDIISGILGVSGALLGLWGHLQLSRGKLNPRNTRYLVVFFTARLLLFISLCIVFNLGAWLSMLGQVVFFGYMYIERKWL